MPFYNKEYQQNNKRVNSKRGRYMKAKRQSTVAPVFGILTQFMGLRKINTIGIQQANKVMHLSAMAYNLKKYLKFITKTVKSDKGNELFCFKHKSLIYTSNQAFSNHQFLNRIKFL